MNLQELVIESRAPAAIVDSIHELVEAKSKTHELGNACRVPVLDSLIRDELFRAAEAPERLISDDDRKAASRLFLELVDA